MRDSGRSDVHRFQLRTIPSDELEHLSQSGAVKLFACCILLRHCVMLYCLTIRVFFAFLANAIMKYLFNAHCCRIHLELKISLSKWGSAPEILFSLRLENIASVLGAFSSCVTRNLSELRVRAFENFKTSKTVGWKGVKGGKGSNHKALDPVNFWSLWAFQQPYTTMTILQCLRNV